MSIPESEWEWLGHAAHFICADRCRFHMATKVGGYLVSSVGDMYLEPDQKKPDNIGCERTHETIVWTVGDRLPCGCYDVGEEVDWGAYNDPQSATAGHMALCRKWADPPEEPEV